MGLFSKKEKLTAEGLLASYSDMVYRIALAQMKQKTDAEDVFQEVFMRLVNSIHKLQSEEHAKHWLIRVTINCCKKQYTSSWRQKTISLDNDELKDIYEKNALDHQEQFHSSKEDFLEICQSLPEGQLEVIYLFYYEGYSIKEISEIIEKSESAVKTRLSRGRDMLRERLGVEESK